MDSVWKKLAAWGRGTPVARPPASADRIDAGWQAAFQAAADLDRASGQIEEAQSRLLTHLSQLYQAFERQDGQRAALLRRVIAAVDYCDGLVPQPLEVGQVRDVLLSALSDQGVIQWAPAIRQTVPEGCEIVAEEGSDEHAPQAVLKIVTRGYRWAGGTVLRSPRVVVATHAPARPSAQGGETALPGGAGPAAESEQRVVEARPEST